MCFALIHFSLWQLALCEIKSHPVEISGISLFIPFIVIMLLFLRAVYPARATACRDGSEAHLPLLFPIVFEL